VATLINWAVFLTSNLDRRFFRSESTVVALINSFEAISLLARPSALSIRTSFSLHAIIGINDFSFFCKVNSASGLKEVSP
jgi:hypothetical protein